jgi:hypothetical protein
MDAYLTRDDFWMFDNIPSLKDLNEATLMLKIEQVSGEIDEYCNTRFLPTEDTFTLDFTERFHTRRGPLIEVTVLFVNGMEMLQNREYFEYPETSRIEFCRNLNVDCYRKAIEVRYIFGHETVPATVKAVIVELVKLDVEASSIQIDGLHSENWDGEYQYSKVTSKDLTPAEIRNAILSRLDKFKVPIFVEPIDRGVVRARLI